MSDSTVPFDPWSGDPSTSKWQPPPLRYPKGMEHVRRPEEEDVKRQRRKPRTYKKNRRKDKEGKEEAEQEEWGVLRRLCLFARDPTFEAYYKDMSLPGEGECVMLNHMRGCISDADGSIGELPV